MGVVRRIILASLPLREAQVKSRYLRQGASARSKHVGTKCAQLQAFGLSVTGVEFKFTKKECRAYKNNKILAIGYYTRNIATFTTII